MQNTLGQCLSRMGMALTYFTFWSHLTRGTLQRKAKPMSACPVTMKSTPEVMRHIQSVIKEATIPSWVRSVPKNFGEAKAGTLKADEWRTLATIYLPLALVSLWGEGSTHQSPEVKLHLRDVLDNTMALVSAIRITCSRTMTHSHIIAYCSCILTWLSMLLNTLPAAKPIPNCHMACHIYDYLKLFGPVRSWWCFPFERLIGHLQHLPINHKFGT